MKFFTFCAFLFKDLVFDRGRSLLTVVSLAAVIVSYLSTSSASEVLLEFGSQPQTGTNNLIVMADSALEPGQSHIAAGTLQSIVDAVRQEYGSNSVLRSSPMIYRSLRFDNKRLQILAVPEDDMQPVYSLVLVEGRWPAGKDQVLVTREAVSLFGYKLGDSLKIRDTRFEIVGQVEQEDARMAAVWMGYSAGRELFELEDDFQLGYLKMDVRTDLPAIQAFLEEKARIPEGYAVYLERQLFELYYHFVADLLKIAYVLAALALGVVCFGVYNTTGLTLMERRRDAAILQTVGFTSRAVRLFLLGRALLQTLVAFLLAWVIVAVIVGGSSRATIAIEAKLGVMRLSPITLALGLVLTLLSASLGVWLMTRSRKGRDLAGELRV